MNQEELLLIVRRSFEKVKSDIKTHDAYIQALKAEIELLKLQLLRLTEKTQQQSSTLPVHNSKIHVKQKILESLSTGSKQLAEIKEIIVDHAHSCSKASFYRYVEELRLSGNIILVETDGVLFVSVPIHATK